MQQRDTSPHSNLVKTMFDLHKETKDCLKHFFGWFHIHYSDNYTRWGKKQSYTCLAFCTDLYFNAWVKMLLDYIYDYCDGTPELDVVLLDVAKLLRTMEVTGTDPDGVFPGKGEYYSVYYFPGIHMEV